MKQKKPLNLNPFVLIFAVVVVAWLFTFIITPATLVDAVYTALPKNAFNFNNVFTLFRAVPMGIKDPSRSTRAPAPLTPASPRWSINSALAPARSC